MPGKIVRAKREIRLLIYPTLIVAVMPAVNPGN
jgi:hypothetical protein